MVSNMAAEQEHVFPDHPSRMGEHPGNVNHIRESVDSHLIDVSEDWEKKSPDGTEFDTKINGKITPLKVVVDAVKHGASGANRHKEEIGLVALGLTVPILLEAAREIHARSKPHARSRVLHRKKK
jgi:hypothetical protein